MIEERSQQKVVFKTKNGRVRSAVVGDLCETFLKFYNGLDRSHPSSFQFIPLIKNYEKATWALVDSRPDLIEKVLKIEVEPEKEFDVSFLRDSSLSIKFPKAV